MKTSTYWRKRMLQEKQKRLEDSAEYELAMKARLKNLERDIEKEALDYLKRYANENHTGLKQAAEAIGHADNWSMTLDEFEARAKAGGFEKELNTEYYKSRIYRLRQLHAQMVKFGEKYGASEELRMRDELINIFNDTYLMDTYSKQVLEGKININFNHFNEQELVNLVYQPWQGSDFSKRIWKNYTKVLPDVLTGAMLKGTLLGYSSDKVVRILRDRLSNVADSNLHRLVITEMGHAEEEATAQFYKDSDIEEYQYLATLESHTCDQCAHLDEKVFKLKDKKEGINYPLIHPYCRCTTMPYMDDLPDLETRWSRDPVTGKGTWKKNMTFNQWKKFTRVKPLKLSHLKKIPIHLTYNEKRAIINYVSSDSYKINSALRNGEKLSENEQDFVNNLDSALNKIPRYTDSRPLQRDYFFDNDQDTADFINQMISGEWFEDAGYISTSKEHYGEGEEQVHVIIKNSKTGADITKYNELEKEVLFPRNTRFKVTKMYSNDQGVKTVVWEELA